MLTRREVKKRIKEQRPLPDEVLEQYPELFKRMEIKQVKVARNPASASQVKRHVRKHLDEDGREYRKMIADDEELKKWLAKNPGYEVIPNPYSSRSRFKHKRIESPSHFDKRSFRTIKTPSGDEITIGCPKGKYDAKRKRCKVGTRAQRVLKPKRRRNPDRGLKETEFLNMLHGFLRSSFTWARAMDEEQAQDLVNSEEVLALDPVLRRTLVEVYNALVVNGAFKP